MAASACQCPTLSSNSPVLLILLPRRKLIWTPAKTAEPRTHLCPLIKEKTPGEGILPAEGWGGREGFWVISVQGHSIWDEMGGYRGYACLSCYDDKMAQPPLCRPPAPLLCCRPLVLPPSGHQRDQRDGGAGVFRGGHTAVSCRLIFSLAHWIFFHYMPHSLISPNLYLLIPGSAYRGALDQWGDGEWPSSHTPNRIGLPGSKRWEPHEAWF